MTRTVTAPNGIVFHYQGDGSGDVHIARRWGHTSTPLRPRVRSTGGAG